MLSKLLKVLPLVGAGLFLVPQANAMDIKQEYINTCVQDAVNTKMANNTDANKLCSCIVDVHSKKTLGQMWEVESYKQSGKDPATLPFVQKLQSDLQQCEQGLTINPPQLPAGQ
ncbi:hypothetical protein [Psychrobacter sp. I-STPA6b]|uniref:hypothetical protein n=1 Tax=Psychrobacter sp. I-STPA6b TaxID=2585718 RepID=UPI001D0C8B0F|nr:hypothetical protein [Psychrobacter sp. I-STPA6b]